MIKVESNGEMHVFRPMLRSGRFGGGAQYSSFDPSVIAPVSIFTKNYYIEVAEWYPLTPTGLSVRVENVYTDRGVAFDLNSLIDASRTLGREIQFDFSSLFAEAAPLLALEREKITCEKIATAKEYRNNHILIILLKPMLEKKGLEVTHSDLDEENDTKYVWMTIQKEGHSVHLYYREGEVRPFEIMKPSCDRIRLAKPVSVVARVIGVLDEEIAIQKRESTKALQREADLITLKGMFPHLTVLEGSRWEKNPGASTGYERKFYRLADGSFDPSAKDAWMNEGEAMVIKEFYFFSPDLFKIPGFNSGFNTEQFKKLVDVVQEAQGKKEDK
jgi:hypothetical protein